MLRLLEKPFDLAELKEAGESAAVAKIDEATRPIPVFEVARDGDLVFATPRARELLVQAANSDDFKRLQDVFSGEIMEQLGEAVSDWTRVEAIGDPDQRLQIRSRWRGASADAPWLVVICPESEPGWTSDSRVRILLDHRSRSQPVLAELGPVVLIERDNALRRLLIAQVERIGALAYPADQLASALRLLEAEPRARTVLLDLELAGDQIGDWMSQIKQARNDVRVIGTGASDVSEYLQRLDIACVLPKPWRMTELLDALCS